MQGRETDRDLAATDAPAIVDLRTDFISRPTPAMIDAMRAAAEMPAGFGLRDDPNVVALERRAADILGKEDALFCPTCTAANQIAIAGQTSPGDRVLADMTAHIITSEGGAPAALSGVMMQGIAGYRGEVPVDDLIATLDSGESIQGRTRLVVIENTHVRSGGTVLSLDYMKHVREITAKRDILVHVDGSRIFNAATALDIDVRVLTALADTVSVSLNKGLGAPLGAILAGSRDLIEKAVVVRHRLGGSWRPAGIPAAAGLVALETMVARIDEDHKVARELASRLKALPELAVDLSQVQTNIVLVDIAEHLGTAEAFAARLSKNRVLALPFGRQRLRLVTWHGIGSREIEYTYLACLKTIRD